MSATKRTAGPLTHEDRWDIRDLYARYAWAIATGDVESFEALYVEGARMADEGARLSYAGKGPGGVRGFIVEWMMLIKSAGRQHWVSQMRFDGDHDRCRVRAYIFAPDQSPSEPSAAMIMFLGFYEDEVVRCPDGEWRFASRRIRQWRGEALEGFTDNAEGAGGQA